ncbi:MAG: DUF3883 domain-containing protein, partial [Sulfolobales archaeon]|nr:DUF3883 domain-containing protein [Sulfolobales archaeon]
VTGQKVLYYAETKDIKELPMSVALTKERKRKFFRVTEANSIKTYLEKDEVGLQELVESILAAKQEIEKEISSKQILYKPRSRNEVENVIKTVGFKDHKEVFDALKNLLKASAPMLGIEVLDEGGSTKIRRGSEMPTYVNTLDDIFTLLDGRSTANESVCIVSQSDGTALISLVPVSIRDRRDGALLYTELVGVDLCSGEILRGTQLIATISQAIRNLVGVTKLDNKDIPIHIIANIIDYEKRGLSEFLHPIEIYRSWLEGRRLRSNEGVWIRRSDIDISASDPVGYLQFVKMSTTSPESVSEEVKREIEKRAIEEVLAYERAKGREPTDVSATEHYDIRSVNPSTGEVRYIEVKGHKGLEISAEITESEAEVAQREKERYWLYIVYDIGSGHPKILEFQNPLETMDMQVFERRERRYFLRPKTGGARD